MNKKFSCLIFFAVFCVSTFSQSAPLSEDEQNTISKAAMAVLDDFMKQFNALNIEAWEATYHFPHYRLASGNMSILEGPSGRSAEDLKKALGKEWHHSQWLSREVLHLSDDKVHINTRFARYREDNSVIATYDSIYVVTLENGRWGIKLRTSMAP